MWQLAKTKIPVKCLTLCVLILTVLTFLTKNNVTVYGPPKPQLTTLSPWSQEPGFQIFLRMSSFERFTKEYKKWLLPSYRYFFPSELAESSLVLDDNNAMDHEFGKSASALWPYPKACYIKRSSKAYNGEERSRVFWDNFYPEKCIQKEYVGYVDSDTLFNSLVTPSTLFKDGKPIVLAHVGIPHFPCWPKTTELWLGHKEVVQCMSYFPVILKVAHLIELREYIAKRFGKSFDQVYKDSAESTSLCLCQFSIMCNYVWYYHREDYHFRLHMGPSDWDGKSGFVDSMAPLDYLRNEIPIESWVPMPRVSIHSRYLCDAQRRILSAEEQRRLMTSILKEGRCYSAGFDLCPDKCREFNQKSINKYIYTFEGWSWIWDHRCLTEQKKYYMEVKSVLQYYDKHGLEFLGAKDKEQFSNELV